MNDLPPESPESESAAQRRQLARLWMEAQPSVLSYITSAVRRFHDAEDILQQVAEDAAARFDAYDPSRPFVAWALGIARFKIADHYRARDRKEDMQLSEPALVALADAHVRQVESIKPMHAALDVCMAELTDRARLMLKLRYEDDLPSAAIADELDTTSKTVRVTLTRIRAQLATCIKSKTEGGDA